MFAGAAREAVFSKPEVVRRINTDFVPVALKAGLVANPPAGDEGRLYLEIGRSKPAPQGICVINSAGKVLDWVLMFDDDSSVLDFLDHCLKRYAEYPNAQRPVAAERYMKFPSRKLPDVKDSGKDYSIVDRHGKGQRCPAKPALEKGTLVGRVIGRALDKDGSPLTDTTRQEHYMEARFEVPVSTQQNLARTLAIAGNDRFKVPDDLARELASNAYLGQLDVNPLGGRRIGGTIDRNVLAFWARRVSAPGQQPVRLRIEGKSDVSGGQAARGRRTDGRRWKHEVKLDWYGYIELSGNRITRLLMVAHGFEKLRWGSNRLWKLKGESDVAHLPAGHPIDLACAVKYGLTATPCAADEVVQAGQSPSDADRPRPDMIERLVGTLGPRFSVLREPVWDDLKLSNKSRSKLAEFRTAQTTSFAKLMQTMQAETPQERPRKIQQYRDEAGKRLEAQLQQLLNPDQRTRLRQIELQQQGLFAIGSPLIATQLEISERQRRQFVSIVQEMQQRFQMVQQRARTAGDRQRRLQQDLVKIRIEHEAKLLALLTDSQLKKWKELIGPKLPERAR